MEFDCLVIGGGSAGCVLAACLSENPAVRVCLLEAGPADTSVLIHCPAGLAAMARCELHGWGQNTTPQPGLNGRRGYQPRGKVLGGSSSVNAMVYTRGQPQDCDHWAAQGNPGWGWSDVLPYFKRDEHNGRGADAWHGGGGPLKVADLRAPNPVARAFVAAGVQAGHAHNRDFNGASQEGVGLYQITQQNGECCSAAKAYLTPHLGRANLQVVTGAHATRILMEGCRAVGVEYRLKGSNSNSNSSNGELRRLRCTREVLLSAGALLSPQLLMLSGIGAGAQLQQHGIATVHDRQHLHDHLDVVQVMDAPVVTGLFGLSPRGAFHILRGMWQWHRQRTGPLTTNFAEAGGFIKSSSGEPVPDLQLHFVIGKLVDHGRQTVLGHGYSCHVCLLQPQSRGSVQLASCDPADLPLVDPDSLGHPDDLPRLVRGVRRMRRMRAILAQPALAKYQARELPASASARSDGQIGQFIRQYADTIHHPVGSCRMGPGALDVVDAELRVHGVQGLRVVDASVMPRTVSGNTNAPIIVVAEKAVDLLRAAGR